MVIWLWFVKLQVTKEIGDWGTVTDWVICGDEVNEMMMSDDYVMVRKMGEWLMYCDYYELQVVTGGEEDGAEIA
jgi:hypothetical protein